ncbi:phosphatase PAP2 family protein [Glutamicibacter arilaitensis]|uniref:phosphatase PAP2 family protein n=1 Tax=Glutamicibacter arilaitensis TaxID=256701 RepID=UPI003FD32FD0
MVLAQQNTSFTSKFAHIITEVFSPFILLAVVITWIGYQTDDSWLRNSFVASLFVSFIPLLISLTMTKLGKVTDKYIQQRRQRHLYYAISLGSILTGLVIMMILPASTELRWITGLAVGTLLVVMAINTKIKISIHALIGALTAIVFAFGQSEAPIAISAIGAWLLVSWSRVHLSRHSFTEVILGSVFGGCVGWLFLVLAVSML